MPKLYKIKHTVKLPGEALKRRLKSLLGRVLNGELLVRKTSNTNLNNF
jgi:hypothetical protein